MADQGIEAEANRERAQGLRNKSSARRTPLRWWKAASSSSNESDDAFFQDHLIQLRTPRNPRGLIKSNQLLWNCFNYFSKRLGEVDSI